MSSKVHLTRNIKYKINEQSKMEISCCSCHCMSGWSTVAKDKQHLFAEFDVQKCMSQTLRGGTREIREGSKFRRVLA